MELTMYDFERYIQKDRDDAHAEHMWDNKSESFYKRTEKKQKQFAMYKIKIITRNTPAYPASKTDPWKLDGHIHNRKSIRFCVCLYDACNCFHR